MLTCWGVGQPQNLVERDHFDGLTCLTDSESPSQSGILSERTP